MADAILGPMAAIIGYSKQTRGWNSMLDAVLEPLSEKTAKKRHAEGGAYGVVLDDDGQLAVIAVWGDKWPNNPIPGGSVKFYDDSRKNTVLVYDYTERGDDWVLTQISRSNDAWGVDRERGRHDWFTFMSDGRSRWKRFDRDYPRGADVMERDDIDQSALCTKAPAFGDYDHLVDREILQRVWPDVEPLPWRSS